MKRSQLLLAAAPLLILVATNVLAWWLARFFHLNDPRLVPELPKIATETGTFKFVLADWSARNFMVVASIAFFLAATVTTGASWYVIFKAMKPFTRWRAYAVGVFTVGVLVFSAFYASGGHNMSQTVFHLETIVSTYTGIETFKLFRFMYVTAMSLLVWVVGAYTAILLPDVRDDNPDATSERDEHWLAIRMQWCRLVLYSGAILFGVCLIYNYLAVAWPAVYMADPKDAALMKELAARSTVGFGAFYSMLLVSAYVPTEAVLRARAAKLAQDAHIAGADERAKWLKDRGLKLNLLQEAPNVIAVASPVLLGALSEVAKRI